MLWYGTRGVAILLKKYILILLRHLNAPLVNLKPEYWEEFRRMQDRFTSNKRKLFFGLLFGFNRIETKKCPAQPLNKRIDYNWYSRGMLVKLYWCLCRIRFAIILLYITVEWIGLFDRRKIGIFVVVMELKHWPTDCFCSNWTLRPLAVSALYILLLMNWTLTLFSSKSYHRRTRTH